MASEVKVIRHYRYTLEVISDQLKKTKATARSTSAIEKNTALYRRIMLWKTAQSTYMPGLTTVLLPEEEDESEFKGKSWDIKLLLPSTLKKEVRTRVCVAGLVEKEKLLRQAEAYDALEDIRKLLLRSFKMVNWKEQHTSGPGQKINTRANAKINELKSKRSAFVKRYRRARNALLELDPDGTWQSELRELNDGDIRAPMRWKRGTGEGNITQSWIWKMRDAAINKKSVRTKTDICAATLDVRSIAESNIYSPTIVDNSIYDNDSVENNGTREETGEVDSEESGDVSEGEFDNAE